MREAHITAEGNITHEVHISFRRGETHRSKKKSTSQEVLFFLRRVEKKMPYSFLLFFIALRRIMICIITAASIKGILQASNIGGNSMNNLKSHIRSQKNQQIAAIK